MRTRHFLNGHFYYVLTVASPPGGKLPDETGRFLSSITFEAVVNASYLRMGTRLKSVDSPTMSARKPADQSKKVQVPKPGSAKELSGLSPEEILKKFLLALAAHDESELRALTLPDDEFDWLLKGSPLASGPLARMTRALHQATMKRLKAGGSRENAGGEDRSHQT